MKKCISAAFSLLLLATPVYAEGVESAVKKVMAAQKVVLTVLREVTDEANAAENAPALRQAVDKLGVQRTALAKALAENPDTVLSEATAKQYSELVVRIQTALYRVERNQKIPQALAK